MKNTLIAVAVLSMSLVCTAAESADPLFDVPRLTNIVIDGDVADWGSQGLRVETMVDENGNYLPAADFDAGFRLGWDTNGLLLLARARDDKFVECSSEAELWRLDGLELFMATRKGGPDMVQPCITPGMDPDFPALRWHIHDYRQNPQLTKTTATVHAVSARTEEGYVVEACLPWSNLGINPRLGGEIGFQIYINDADGPEKKISLKWFPRGETHADTKNMHRLYLSTKASPPVLAAAAGAYENRLRTKITVRGAAELVGQDVTVRAAGQVLTNGILADKDGRAFAEMLLPMPPRGERYPPMEMVSEDGVIAHLDLPDPEELVSKDLIWSEFRAFPFCFQAERFPEVDFKVRCEAETLIGPYSNRVAWYDCSGSAVTSAVSAGRYAAVLEVQPEQGRLTRRFLTAFRYPAEMQEFELWKFDPKIQLELPSQLGVDPQTLEEHRDDVKNYAWARMVIGMNEDPYSAVLMAGLYDAQTETDKDLARESTGSIERQWWVDFKRTYYGTGAVFTNPVVAPRPLDGAPAPVVRNGTVAEAGVATDAVERIDAVLSEWAGDTDEAFAVCLVRHGVVFFQKAYGMRNGEPMSLNTLSWMASITKFMSGTLMMMLVDEGIVGLDDPIEMYLPAFRGVTTRKPITIRHLYTHTTGLRGDWGDDMNDLEERVAYHAPYLPVGERFDYNGAGFAVGGKIIEMVSGEAIPFFYKHHLLGPLGMTNTWVTGTAGDASSVPLDMARFGQMLLNRGAYGDKRFMSEETLQSMLPQKLTKTLGPEATQQYGIGCAWMGEDTLGAGTFGHGAASSATFLVSPSLDLVVVMCRDSAGSNFHKYHPKFLKAVAAAMGGEKN